MGLFHVLWTVQMVPNHAKGHRLEDLEVSKVPKKESRTKSGEVLTQKDLSVDNNEIETAK